MKGDGREIALCEDITPLVHIQKAQLIIGRQVPGVEFKRLFVSLLGQLELAGVALNPHQVIGQTVEKLQIRIGDIKFQSQIDQA